MESTAAVEKQTFESHVKDPAKEAHGFNEMSHFILLDTFSSFW